MFFLLAGQFVLTVEIFLAQFILTVFGCIYAWQVLHANSDAMRSDAWYERPAATEECHGGMCVGVDRILGKPCRPVVPQPGYV